MQDRLADATAQVIFRATLIQGRVSSRNLGFDADALTSMTLHLVSWGDVIMA